MISVNNNMLANLVNITSQGISKLKTYCADINLSNITSNAKSTVSHLAFPDYSKAIDYTSSWGTAVTTQFDGWLWVNGNSTQSSYVTVYMNGNPHILIGTSAGGASTGGCWFPVVAGNTWQVVNGDGSGQQILFYPAIGAS